MKKQKWALLLGVALLSTSLFAGCSKEANTVNETPAPKEEVTPEVSPEVSPETSPEAEVPEQTEPMKTGSITVDNEGRKIPATFVMPENAENVPLVVMTHGFGGNKDEGGGFTRIADLLSENGIASIRMDFSGCGESETSFQEFSLENNMSDVNACLSYVMDNASIDKERIGIFGYSMGGALAVMLSNQENSPYKAMVLLAPGTQMDDARIADTNSKIEEAKADGYVKMEWFGNELEVSSAYYEGLLAAFEEFKVYDNTCDTIVIYGDKDEIVLPEHSEAFAKQMDVESVKIEGADHGYGFYTDQPEVTQKLQDTTINFLVEKLASK